MDSLIEHFGDVKELRSGKVLYSALGSDKEVAQLFNTIGTDLVPNSQSYLNIRRQIEKHYRNTCRTWIAFACHKYFGNPCDGEIGLHNNKLYNKVIDSENKFPQTCKNR